MNVEHLLIHGSGVTGPHWGKRVLATSLAIFTGVMLALLICMGGGQEGKVGLLVVGVIGAVGLIPVVSWFSGLAPCSLLFLLSVTLSVSIKKHLWFDSEHIGGAIGVRISITEVLMVGLLLTLCGAYLRGRPIRILRDRAINLAFGVYLFFATCSMLTTNAAALAFYQWTAIIQAFVVFLFLLNYLNSAVRLKIFIAGLLVGLVLQSGVAIAQALDAGFPDLSWLGAAQEEEDIQDAEGGLALPEIDEGTTFVGDQITHRPAGMLLHPNVLGLYLALTIPVAIAVWLSFAEWYMQLLGAMGIGAGGAALYYSLSRSGWTALAGALALGTILAWRWRLLKITPYKRMLIALACFGLIAVGIAHSDRILARLKDTADDAIDFRRDLAIKAVRMAVDHPFFGAGLNSFTSVERAYDDTGATRLRSFPVHNTFLLELSETGLPGGVAFIVMVFVLGKRGFRAARECQSPAAHALTLLTTCGFVGFWIGDMSNFVYRIPIMTSLIWAYMAMVLATARVCGSSSAEQTKA